MIIQAAQINHYLNPLKNIYLISGDEPYLKLKTAEVIRAKAKENHFEQRLFVVDNQFSLGDLQDHLDNFSLFEEKSLVELRAVNKLNTPLKQFLQTYAENPADDKLLLIVIPKLDAAEQKTKWFKAIAGVGVVVQIWPIQVKELPRWIMPRFQQAGFKLEPVALSLVVEKCENNLLAVDQIIERLKILNAPSQISVDILLECVADNAHYDIFQFADCVLQGDVSRMKKQLLCLKQQGAEPLLILWAIAKDLRVLAEAAQKPQRVDTVLNEQRVFKNRYALIKQSLSRHTQSFWYDSLLKAQELDCVIKGVKAGDIWQELLALCTQISA